MPDRRELGRRLAALRGKVSQRKLSKDIGVSNAHISSVEAGNDNPSLDLLERWAEATGHRLVLRFAPKDQRSNEELISIAEQVAALPNGKRELVLQFVRLVAAVSDEGVLSVLEDQIGSLARRYAGPR